VWKERSADEMTGRGHVEVLKIVERDVEPNVDESGTTGTVKTKYPNTAKIAGKKKGGLLGYRVDVGDWVVIVVHLVLMEDGEGVGR
jgi:hypothetical protein